MKILHTSDWHLGIAEETTSLREDQEFFIDEICKVIEEKNVDAVLIAGDVYDRPNTSAEAIRLYDSAMTRICKEMGKTVIEIAGNHDNAARLSNCSDLLSKAGLHVCGSLKREPAFVEVEDVQIFMLPWITEEKVKSIFPEKKEEITSLTEAYRVVTESFKEAFILDKRHILVSHAFITDSEVSESDRAAVIGFASQVSGSVFEAFDYVALGHIHKPQDVTDKIRYSGTPMPFSFGKEEKQEKSVTIIDTADMSREIVKLDLLHKRSTITGTFEEVTHAELSEDVKNGYVRVEITDQYVGLESLSILRGIYPNIIYVSGKSYENENSTISLTMEEFERIESDPQEIFKQYCREVVGEEADEHLLSLFREAVKEVEEAEE